MGTIAHYCFDCGSRLVYYATLSNTKAPNEHRILTYGCMQCSKESEKPKLISVKRNQADDPFDVVRLLIVEEMKYVKKT